MAGKKGRTIGIIGYGNMGSAISERLKKYYRINVFDKDTAKTKGLSGVEVADTIQELVAGSDVVILAVKPQDFDTVLGEIKGGVKNKLIVSIAAGITSVYIEKKLGSVKVVRVMPNLPAKLGVGMICLSAGKRAKPRDLSFVKTLFKRIGKTMIIPEKMMNEDTGISGSGPGYYYQFCPAKTYNWPGSLIKFEKEYFIPSLSVSAQAVGFSRYQADFLSVATAEGSRALLLRSGLSPETLRKQVTSKKGTTEAALKVFQKAGSRRPDKKVWIKAVKAAVKRAKELSRG